MALNLKLANAAVNAEADALSDQLDNGYLRIYDGTHPATADTAITTQTLLAELRFNATAAPAASAGVLTFNAFTSDPSANASGTATWFRALGLLRFVATGDATQAVQSASGTGVERFAAVGATAQAAQGAAGAALLRFVASGATAQASQAASGVGVVGGAIVGVGAIVQAPQTATGTGEVEEVAVPPLVGSGSAAIPFRFEPPTLVLVTGTGRTRQAPQRTQGRGAVNDDALILELTDHDLLGIAA